MNPNPEPRNAERRAEAEAHQWLYKTPAMARMAVAICKLAIEKAGGEFSANDLPEFTHGGDGICGTIFKRLIDDGILARVGIFDADNNFLAKIVFNKGGNKIGVYRMASGGLARALLAVHDHGEQSSLKQGEML